MHNFPLDDFSTHKLLINLQHWVSFKGSMLINSR